MDFHLSFPTTPFPNKISYKQTLMFIGSCFSENMGELMQQYKFNVNINPNGVLFNPISIGSALSRIIANKPIKDDELFFANECWNSWEHHSRYSNTNKNNCINEINATIHAAHQFIKQSDWLFITFGSAHAYVLNSSGNIVGNCHKQPQKEFTKKLLTTQEIVSEYNQLLSNLKSLKPDIKVVFTVSPVRYIRDGVVENNLSKARLIDAVHQLVSTHDNTYYFPAYELVIDDLRDYRFYKSDMVHPNEQAIEYVFENLKNNCFDEDSLKLFAEIKNIVNAISHKPFNTDTAAHQKFRKTFFERCNELQNRHPYLNLNTEFEFFRD